MPYGKPKGGVNVQGELLRLHEKNRILREALKDALETLQLCETLPNYPQDTPEYGPVRALCDRYGYGAVMACASSQWMDSLPRLGYPMEGAHVSGPCVATALSTIDHINRAMSV